MPVSLSKTDPAAPASTKRSEPDNRLQQVEETLLDLVMLIARTEARRFRRSSRGVTHLRLLLLIALVCLTIMIGVLAATPS
ncbi:hypothetical protein [Azospirillum largimobile]